MDLAWIDVTDSERIVAMAYDASTETIYVRFPNGVVWRYESCSDFTWDEFRSAPSKGTYIHQILNHRPNGRVV